MKYSDLSQEARILANRSASPNGGKMGRPGMTIREVYAKDALEAIVNANRIENINQVQLAEKAVSLANSLCQALVDDRGAD